jgi:nicotinamidase-related amidase
MITPTTYVTPQSLDAKTAGWLAQIAPFNFRKRIFAADSSALLIVDMQRCFLEEGYPLSCENARVIVPRIAQLIAAFRKAGRPVIFLAQMNKAINVDRGVQLSNWWSTPPLEGTPGVEIHPALSPRPEEKLIPKRRYSGFHATDLDLTLRVMKVADVVVCGTLTNVCVEGTVRDAFMHDYRAFLPADATASLNEEMHLAALRTMAGWYATVTEVRNICDSLCARSTHPDREGHIRS